MHLLPLPLGLASPVSGCYSAYQKRDGAPSMEELMNEQKPQCRVQASEKPRRGWCSFPHCGLEYKQLFSCCTSMLCLPHTPFLSHPPPLLFQVPLLLLATFFFWCSLYWGWESIRQTQIEECSPKWFFLSSKSFKIMKVKKTLRTILVWRKLESHVK